MPQNGAEYLERRFYFYYFCNKLFQVASYVHSYLSF
jgi:hypothetical protein